MTTADSWSKDRECYIKHAAKLSGVYTYNRSYRIITETLENYLQSIVEWDRKLLVNCLTLLSFFPFNNYKKTSWPTIVMTNNILLESPSFKLLDLTFTWQITWNDYIEGIATAAAKKVGLLYCARKWLSPDSILYLYNPQFAHACSIVVPSGLVHLSLFSR